MNSRTFLALDRPLAQAEARKHFPEGYELTELANDWWRAVGSKLAAIPPKEFEIAYDVKPVAKPHALLSRHISAVLAERTEVDWIPGLENIAEHEVLGVMAGPRGVYKSAVVLRLLMTAALGGTPVYVFSGEGGGLQRRLEALRRDMAPKRDVKALPFYCCERRVNVATSKGLEIVAEEMRALKFKRGVIVFDTFSKYSAGLDSYNNPDVSKYLDGLSKLRAEFKASILLIAHTGHGDQSRPKGASSLTQDTECEWIVSHDKTSNVVSITRERFKDSPALSPLRFKPRIVDLGYKDKRGEPVTSIVLDQTDEVPATRGRPANTRTSAILRKFGELAKSGPVTRKALQAIAHEMFPTVKRPDKALAAGIKHMLRVGPLIEINGVLSFNTVLPS